MASREDMIYKKKKREGSIAFEDLFSLDKIQRLQDEFADATGVASIITTPDGCPITKPSNFCRLCKDIIRDTEKGLANCFKSDAIIGRYHPEGPIIQRCMSGGLWDAGAGITVGGKHIANWLIGQVRDENQSDAEMKQYALEIGADETMMLNAFREVPSMSLNQFTKIANMLFTLANQLSDSAYQNLQKTKFIEERQQFEKKLVQSEEQYRALVESASDFIWEIDDNGFYTYVSPKIKDMLGYDPVEMIGTTPFDFMDEPEAERVRQLFMDAVQKKAPILSLVNENHHKNGQIVILESSGVPVIDPDGHLKGYRGIDRDITRRKKTEQKLKERKAALKSIFISAPVGIGMVLDRRLTFVNQRCCEMAGYTADELMGRNARVLYPDQKEFEWVGREKYDQISQTGTATMETRWQQKDGTIIHVLLNFAPLDASDRSKGDTFSALDFTEKIKTDRELAQHRDHLEAMIKKRTAEINAKNKELEMFTYSVSHDLKAPLRGIDGYSRLLVEEYSDKLDEDGLFFLNNVRQGTTQMNTLIEDLLAYSRMERKQLHHTSIDLKSLIDNLVDQRTHDIEQCQITLKIAVPFHTIKSDTETLRQVLTNYLDNAIKYSKKDASGTVTIGGSQTDDHWTLWVKDDGIGFDPKYLDRIFDIFQRLHRVEEYPGTGIGLAIVRKAVERIGGRVRANSAPGKGSTFYLDIPKPKHITS